jgi:hypothetical protein
VARCVSWPIRITLLLRALRLAQLPQQKSCWRHTPQTRILLAETICITIAKNKCTMSFTTPIYNHTAEETKKTLVEAKKQYD